jgi:hypothetical protein
MSPAVEMRELLLKMLTLSEQSAAPLERNHSANKPGHKAPPGYGRTTNRKGEPDEDWSLYEHYSYRFEHAESDLQERVIVLQARVALRQREKGPEPWKLEQAHRTETEEIAILLKDGEGIHAAELAATTGWPQSWIHTQRERNGREPEYGRVRPNWQALTGPERRTKAHRYCSEGYSCRKAARELGIAHTTLARYWPNPNLEAA